MFIDKKLCRNLIYGTAGRIFSVHFVKRSTKEVRQMSCRLGVRKHLKGGERSYDPDEKGLVFVFDVVKGDYRCIPLDSIEKLTIDGKTFEVI